MAACRLTLARRIGIVLTGCAVGGVISVSGRRMQSRLLSCNDFGFFMLSLVLLAIMLGISLVSRLAVRSRMAAAEGA